MWGAWKRFLLCSALLALPYSSTHIAPLPWLATPSLNHQLSVFSRRLP